MNQLYFYKAKTVKVVDGDTIDLEIDLGFYTVARKRIRFLDFDSDELRGGTVESKARANVCKDHLITLLETPGSTTYIKTKMDSTGKYGRVLGHIYVEEGGRFIDVIETLRARGFTKGCTDEVLYDIVYKEDPWV